MTTATPRVIAFHYTLTDPDGETLDSSSGGEPLSFLEGVGQIIPGLERQLALLAVGDKRRIDVKAPDAYGEHKDELLLRIEEGKFPKKDITIGDMFQIQGFSDQPLTVVDISEGFVILDGNHPLAGIDLTFDVEVMSIRPATTDEVKHGHAHGPDGHHHH